MKFECEHCDDGDVAYVRYGEYRRAEPEVGLEEAIVVEWVECECGRVTEGNELDLDVYERLVDEALERGRDDE